MAAAQQSATPYITHLQALLKPLPPLWAAAAAARLFGQTAAQQSLTPAL
jgi:hypothetical protein